jgi:hypothetical protein
MTEATTAITDFLLGAVTFYFAWSLLARRVSNRPRTRIWWGIALAAAATAAWTGGAYHALLENTSASVLAILWRMTALAIAVAAFALVPATATAFLPKAWRQIAITAAALKAAAFSVAAFTTDDFLLPVLDYGMSLLFVLVVALLRRGTQPSPAGLILAGIAIAAAGAAIQQAGFSIHPRFNHNDLYHVVQIAANFAFFRGASRLHDVDDS